MDGDERGYYSVSEAAALLGVSRVSVWRWVRDGKLVASRLGQRTTRIRREDLDQLTARTVTTGSRWPVAGNGDLNADATAGADSPPEAEGTTGAPEHVVQFYETDAFLLDAVAEFIGAGLRAGHAGIALVTESHGAGLEERLRAAGVDPAAARDRGHFVLLDAATVLAEIMVDGVPDADRFGHALDGLIARATAGGRPAQVFGELVALLANDGNHTAACRLEQLWNDLQQRHDFALMCGYALDGFTGEELAAQLDQVCAEHTRVIPAESYTALTDHEDRLLAIATLQQKAASLEHGVAQRTDAERRLEAALASERRNERELSDFLETATIGLHRVGPDGVILWANRAEIELLGYQAEEYIGRHIADFHADQPVIDDIMARLARGEILRDYPARLRAKDGAIKHVLIDSSGLWEDGQFRYTRCFTRDITARTQAEASLRARTRHAELTAEVGAAFASGQALSEQLQQCAEAIVSHLDASVARIWTLTTGAGFLELRASAGLTTRLDGEHASIPVGDLDIGRIAAGRQPLLTNDLPSDPRISAGGWEAQASMTAFAGYPLLVDDRLVGVLALVARHPLADDTLAGLAAVANTVATAIDRAHLLGDVSAALERERQHAGRLGGLTEAALAIAAPLALDDVLQLVTDQARRIIGTHLAVVSLTDDCWAHSTVAASLSDKYAAYRDYAEPPRGIGIYTVVAETNQPLRLTQAELEAHPRWRGFSQEAGKHPPLRGWLAAPLVGRDGGNLGVIQLSDKLDGEFTAEDEAMLVQLAHLASLVIQNVRLFGAEQGARATAELAIAQRDTVLGSVSHDLKNPLSVIKSQAQLLARHLRRSDEPDIDRLVAGLTVMDETTARMESLIDELVDVARLQAGQALELAYQPCDLVALVRQCGEEHQRTTGDHAIKLETSLIELTGHWDRRRLQRVIDNLLSNAIKYSPDGGEIILRLTREEGDGGPWAVLAVRDHGVGIPAADLPHVFERFWRGGNVGVIAGSGIGLAGTRQIIEQHGGTIAATSEDGAGSTFTVRLPLDPPATA